MIEKLSWEHARDRDIERIVDKLNEVIETVNKLGENKRSKPTDDELLFYDLRENDRNKVFCKNK